MENGSSTNENILSVDIGGSKIKATLLSAEGALLTDYKKLPTPEPASPEKVIETILQLAKNFKDYSKVSVGFPGYIKNGIVSTAPNLNTQLWKDVNLTKRLSDALQRPVRLINDADMLGLGVISGKGLEMVVTLGTGFGTAFTLNGILLPHLEIGQHPFTKEKNYDQYVGDAALESIGEERWKERIRRVLAVLKTVFNYDVLFIGGGNSKLLNFPLDDNIKIFTNKDGIKGGARLWKQSTAVDGASVSSFA
jgi:polyphosphate glucokinase